MSSDKNNANFIQLSRNYLKQWRGLSRKNPLASEVLMYLIEHMGRTTNAVVCSYRVLEEALGVSRSTVGRAIKTLKEDRWIDTVKVGSATAYCVNERAFWQAGRNQRKYAIFSATVVASESEQPSGFREVASHSLKHIPFINKNESILINQNEELDPPDQQDLDV